VLRSIAHTKGVTIPASGLGKAKMVMQVVAIVLLMLGNQVRLFYVLGTVALWGVLIVALVSAIDYYRRYSRWLAHPNVTDFESARKRASETSRRVG
jgi:CDP-diacylglycerol--glycerol-3-phosphate 3-phosphatidyltransferase